MLFIVEINLDGNLGEQLGNMRTWLDHKHCDAVAFRRSRSGWHVDFESENKAREFAQAFYGRMLNAAGPAHDDSRRPSGASTKAPGTQAATGLFLQRG